MVQINMAFYMLIPISTITQDQVDNSTSNIKEEMAVLGTDYICEVEEPQLMATQFYTGIRRYTKKQIDKVIRDFE